LAGIFSLAKEPYTGTTHRGTTEMQFNLWKLYTKLQSLAKSEEGQDLIEYALVVALIVFAATASMSTLANDINAAFSNIGSVLTSYIG
jgi:pilus assembly protein Flp/PilA